jgi:hypothetical protein
MTVHKPRTEISGETIPTKILIKNDEKNKCIVLNNSLQNLIQPFWRQLDFSQGEIYDNMVE